MDSSAATTEVENTSTSPVPLAISKLLTPPPVVGKTEDGKKLLFRIPGGEDQAELVHLCTSVAEVRECIHNCLMHGRITDAKHQELCGEIALYSSLPTDSPGAYWYRFQGPAAGLLCPMIHPRPQAKNPNEA